METTHMIEIKPANSVEHSGGESHDIVQKEKADEHVPDNTDASPNNRHIIHHFRQLQMAHDFWKEYTFQIVVVILAIALLIYTIAAISISGFKKALPLLVMSLIIWFLVIYMFIRNHFGEQIYKNCCKPVGCFFTVGKRKKYLKWTLALIVLILVCVWFGVETIKHPKRFISVVGLLVYIGISYILSVNRKKIKWRPVLWGIFLQVLFALIILRTSFGLAFFKFVGDNITVFLEYSDYGAKFVFGDSFKEHFIAFKVLPVIVFFSSMISVLYHLGIMQLLIEKIAWLMHVTMGTSGAESLNAAGNIFVGSTESPLMIRPFLATLTMSELHAVMTSGLATVAGSVLGAYVFGGGVKAYHLISASVMSAPAALAVSKLMWPETEVSETRDHSHIPKQERTERNLIEAAAKGASVSIALVANIAAMLISFFAFLKFINNCFSWIGGMVGHPELSFEFICSYVLMPFAFLMGVDWDDCNVIAKLLGIKTFLNELIAYIELKPLIEKRSISLRSEIIATYALCGFSNFLGLAIILGGLGPMAPSRKGDMARIGLRTLVAATLACFMTASIAGFLYDPSLEIIPRVLPGNSTSTNSTALNTTMVPTTIP